MGMLLIQSEIKTSTNAYHDQKQYQLSTVSIEVCLAWDTMETSSDRRLFHPQLSLFPAI
jgi:hypothetical protein